MFPERVASWKTRKGRVSSRASLLNSLTAAKKSTKIKAEKYSLAVTRR